TRSPSRQGHPFADRGEGFARHDVNLLAINGDGTVNFAADTGPALFDHRYSIGTWAWETDRIPDRWAGALELVDEIWMPSDYSRAAVAAATDKPTFTFPHPIVVPPPPAISRAAAGLPPEFTFLFAFDFFSRAERKNPLGLLQAFRRAFPEPGPATLLIKTANGANRPEELRRLREAAGGRADIRIQDDYVPVERLQALIGLCDCYVSLHRAEGFGLTLAEAMAQGRPVIGTAYSGNLAFMTEANSYLCGYRLVPVGEEAGFYSASGHWAEPDLADAARLMRQVFENREEAAARGARALEDVRLNHSPAARAALIRERYAWIRANRLPNPRFWGGDWSAATPALRAELRVAREPGLDLPTRSGGAYGALARLARRAFRRMHMPYQVHQDTAGRAIAEALWEQVAETERLRRRVEALEAERGGRPD
ncbi:MAG TPA: glycosyltransferase, partial [Candidatus Dormibacteraeota bacterium]|nr:glycosyltransferase [Candidatus Dormibacteraeota bacterium]